MDRSEALAIGLASRIVPAGQGLNVVELLPQCTASCEAFGVEQRSTVASQAGRRERRELAGELRGGCEAALATEAPPGAARFTAGEGRHGAAY